MTRWFDFLITSLCTCLFMVACGGGESRPGPLGLHLDDMHIAQVPMTEQQDVFKAQTEYNKAKASRAKASADYEQSAADLEVARNQAQQAALDENSAQTQKEAAEKRGNMNEINEYSLRLRATKISRQAADRKVKYMELRREYLKEVLNYNEDQMYAKEARFELTKAKLAYRKEIRPQGFSITDYEKQDQERSRFAQRSRSNLVRKRAELEKEKQEWKRMEAEAIKAKGESVGGAGAGGV